MALFGKNKKAKAVQEDSKQQEAVLEQEDEVTESASEENDSEAAQSTPEPTTEEVFKNACAELGKRVRFMFPQQMYIGFYYGELQEDGYIDDFCCYAGNGRLIEKQEIPALCKISLPDMVSREEKLEQAFFKMRRAAIDYTEKNCNAIFLTIMGNGQLRIDITSEDLVEGEEDIRYGRFRKKVEMANPRYMPPKIEKEKMAQIQKQTEEIYRSLGTEFFSYLPDTDFRVGYFYAENGENGIFHYTRLVTNDGEIIDEDEIFERYSMDKEEVAKNRIEVVKLIMAIRQIFVNEKQKPFTSITLSVSGKGEFQSHLGFGPVDAAGEQERLETWKSSFRGITPSKNK